MREVNVRVQRVVHRHGPKNEKQRYRGCELSEYRGVRSENRGTKIKMGVHEENISKFFKTLIKTKTPFFLAASSSLHLGQILLFSLFMCEIDQK